MKKSLLLACLLFLQQLLLGQNLVNNESNMILDAVWSTIHDNGCNVNQWEYNGNPNQQWEFVYSDKESFWIKSHANGKAISVDGTKTNENGANVVLWEYYGGKNQQWEKKDIGNGWFWLKNVESGKALAVDRGKIFQNGANVVQWDYHGTPNHIWSMSSGQAQKLRNANGSIRKIFPNCNRIASNSWRCCGAISVNENGRISSSIKTSTNRMEGFTGAMQIDFLNKNGVHIYRVITPSYGISGTLFGGENKRQDNWATNISKEYIEECYSVKVKGIRKATHRTLNYIFIGTKAILDNANSDEK